MGIHEITFRGKRKSDGQWVEGDLSRCVVVGETHICRVEDNLSTTTHRIDPETVCQYTGLTDKNGRKIFEGDILSHDEVGNIKVQFKNSEFLVHGITHNMFSTLLSSVYRGCEIIGNIFDNPELIREKD